MGQALAKSYEGYSEHQKNRVQRFRSYHSQLKNNNNLNNNDYDIENIKSKIENLREYLNYSYDRNYEEEGMNGNEGVQTMNNNKYTVKEVSEILGVSVRTIEKYISSGKLAIEWGKGKTGKIRLITSEALQVMKENEVVKHDVNRENCEPVDRSVIRENGITEIIEPEKYLPEPKNNFVTREELNSYTLAIKDFTNTLADIKHQQELERQENKIVVDELRNENAQLVKKVEHLIGRVSRVDEFIELWRQEQRDRQKLPWWRKLFKY